MWCLIKDDTLNSHYLVGGNHRASSLQFTTWKTCTKARFSLDYLMNQATF